MHWPIGQTGPYLIFVIFCTPTPFWGHEIVLPKNVWICDKNCLAIISKSQCWRVFGIWVGVFRLKKLRQCWEWHAIGENISYELVGSCQPNPFLLQFLIQNLNMFELYRQELVLNTAWILNTLEMQPEDFFNQISRIVSLAQKPLMKSALGIIMHIVFPYFSIL